MNDPERDLDELLRDGTWLRRFVGTLVARQDVDDVVQATRLAALQTTTPATTEARHWLFGIGRNLARMLHRSRSRSSRALAQLPRGGEAPSAAELVEGLEVQRAVSEALLALPEPTRTILVLRYQHDLGPAAIATRTGLQEAAVRQRLHRGREEVRARLQQRFGADWRGSLAVLAFVGRDPVRPATAGASAMVAGAAVLAIATGTTFLVAATSGVDAQPAGSAVTNAATTVAAEAPARPVDMAMPTQERGVVRELVASAQDPKPSPSEGRFTIRGRLVAAESGAPLQGTLWRRVEAKMATAADGTFAVPVPASRLEREEALWIDSDGRCQRWCCAQPRQDLDLGDIPMTIGYSVRGRVVDEAGAPMAKVRVEALIDGEFPRGGAMGYSKTTDANGWFTFKRPLLPAGEVELRAGTSGFELLDGRIRIEPPPTANEFVLHAKRSRAIRGHAFTLDGRPCNDVELEATVAQERLPTPQVVGSCRSQADGSFELFEHHPGHEQVQLETPIFGGHDLFGKPMQLAWGATGVRVEVRARVPVQLTLVEAGSRKPIEECCVIRTWITGTTTRSTQSDPPHTDGKVTFDGVSNGCRIELWPTDPMLAPMDLMVDESMRTDAERVVEFARLQPFTLTLVDPRGNPIQTDCSLLDRCGAAPGSVTDRRAGILSSGQTALRVSATKTDADGKATLMAPITTRELVLEVRSGKQKHWLPVQPSKTVTTLRLVVPD